MNISTSRKALASIPRDVYLSALQSRPGIAGSAFRAIREYSGTALALLVFVAPLCLVTWVFCAFSDDPGKLRWSTTAFLAVVFASCLAYHCLELFMAIPWADMRYPALLRESSVYSLLARSGYGYSLSATTAAYAALLWLAWSRGWQAGSGQRNTLLYAALNTTMAVAMYLYGRFQPYGAFRAPTMQDRQWLASCAPDALVDGTKATSAIRAEQKPAEKDDYVTPVTARDARMRFNDIFGMQELKERLLKPARAIVGDRSGEREPPANGILLHGEPGNGKTVFAEALAGELQVPIVTLTYGDVASKWLGEMPRLISRCFEYARANAPCVLFVDEIDSFLRSRTLSSNNSEDLKIVNTLLTEIVDIRDHRVVLVAATNFLENLDRAAIREGRFDLKLEVTAPDEAARLGILRASAAKYASHFQIEEDAMGSVAKRWDGFSASRLVAICKALPECADKEALESIRFDEWSAALRLVQGTKARAPAGSKQIRELVLERHTHEALQALACRMRDVRRIESLGGTLPTGILLHGAPGTGKTAAARALALETGWAFLEVSGPDLTADRERLNRIYSEAQQLRPAIIFIDEADDALADRAFARAADIVSRLLTILDGARSRSRDVVFIAATNRVDQADPALLRAGRFGERIEFMPPPVRLIPRIIKQWLQARDARLEAGLPLEQVAFLLGSQTAANVEGVLEYALNQAIVREADRARIAVTREDIAASIRVVCGRARA
jgi:transitional endoplasmic reticulum ATPase